MKRKIISVLFALVLVVTLGLVTGVPAGTVQAAGTAKDCRDKAIEMGDWLVNNQAAWTSGASYKFYKTAPNILALALLYEETGDLAYLTAAENAADFVTTYLQLMDEMTSEGWTFDGASGMDFSPETWADAYGLIMESGSAGAVSQYANAWGLGEYALALKKLNELTGNYSSNLDAIKHWYETYTHGSPETYYDGLIYKRMSGVGDRVAYPRQHGVIPPNNVYHTYGDNPYPFKLWTEDQGISISALLRLGNDTIATELGDWLIGPDHGWNTTEGVFNSFYDFDIDQPNWNQNTDSDYGVAEGTDNDILIGLLELYQYNPDAPNASTYKQRCIDAMDYILTNPGSWNEDDINNPYYGIVPSVMLWEASGNYAYLANARAKGDEYLALASGSYGWGNGSKIIRLLKLAEAVSVSEVWVDDGWAGLTPGDSADGHTFDYDAFATIQDGIDVVAEEGTVNVAAGTYDSSLETFPITISKSLTLLGAQANVDPRPSQGGRTGDESIIDADETSSAVIQISASDVEINGFTITGGKGDMVEESGSANNLLFRYNILYDDLETCNWELAWDSPDRGDEGIQIKNSDGVVMEYNYAYNICEDAFNLSDSTDGAIRYNEAHDIYSENAAIYCYGSTGLEIRGNLIYDVPNNDSIKLGDKDGSDAGTDSNSVIAQNIVHDTAQDGISVYTSGVTVEGNEVYNSSSENGAIYLAWAISDITIQNNSVHDNVLSTSKQPTSAGILIEERVDVATVTINFNNIYNNSPYGVTNEVSATLDATKNWWGTTNDPAIQAMVSGNVDYSPWWGASYLSGTAPNIALVAHPWTWYTNDSIQDAINAAEAGDTIIVAAGTYNENVVIPAGKDNLEIIGHSRDDTFVTVGSGIGFDCYCPVTITGFDISGAARGSGHAFKLRGGSAGTESDPGVFEDNKVHSLNYGMTTGDYTPRPEYWDIKGNDFYDLRIGVLMEHSYHIEISGNTFADYKEGVTMGYDADTARYIDIIDNEFLGTTDTELGAAILISSAAQEIQVLRNEINDSIVGVLIKQKDATVPDLTNVNINFNNIQGNTTGVLNEAALSVDATYNWWGTKAKGRIKKMVSGNVDYDPWHDEAHIQSYTTPSEVWVNDDFTDAIEGWGTTHFATIQGGVDAVAESGTVSVAAGTYYENVVVDETLTLQGEDRGTTVIKANVEAPVLTISADGVTVSGFTIDDDGKLDGLQPYLITVKANDTLLSDLYIIRQTPLSVHGGGVLQVGEWYAGGFDSFTFTDSIVDSAYRGVDIWSSSSNIVIQNVDFTCPGDCVLLLLDTIGATITENTFMCAPDMGVVVGGNSQDIEISDNQFVGSADKAIRLDGGGTMGDVDILRNEISGFNTGILLSIEFGDLVTSGISIHYNNIYDNTDYGLNNKAGETVDATNNWWGTTTDAEVDAMVSDNVAYDPWHLKQITDLAVSNPTESSVDLSWTTTGAWDGDYFDVRYSTSPITAENWSKAKVRRVTGEPTPATTVNTRQGMRVHGLKGNTTYHFGLKLIDKDIGSSDSNIVSATTQTTAPTDTTPPSAITDLGAATGKPPTKKVILSWTAKGDDETDGIASKYIIKRSTSGITAANFDSATTVRNNLRCKSNGESESFTVRRLTPNTTYYFAIKIQDEVPNTSAISNVVSITTANFLPTVTNISPTTADNGAAIILTITGTNFTTSGTTVVRLISDDNTFHLPNVTYVSATRLTAVVPKGAPTGTYKARVINNNGRSALSSATYIVTAAPTPPPAVTNLIPQMAASSTAVSGVKIFGENFTGATAVSFGDTAASNVTVISDTKITADVPGLAAGEYDVKVTTTPAAGTNEVSAVKFVVSDQVVVNKDTTEDTTTSEVIDLGDTNVIPVQITLTTDTSETATQATDTDAEIEVVIPPETTVTCEGKAYTGNINPPRVVKPDESVFTDLADDAVVIEMGNPEETINFDQDFVATIIITADTEPVIWYYNKDTKAYELAGKTGTKDGIDYVPGGTKLGQEDNTYTMGLLLDHMSNYIAGVNPHITSAPTATAGQNITITGTNFHPTGANVYFNGTAGTIISRTSTTQIVVTFPTAGIYTLKVENPDKLSHTTSITLTAPAAPPAFSVSNLSIQPLEVQPGEAVTITVSVANTGGTEGSYSAVLMIDGVKEAEKSVTVAAGSSGIVSFLVTRADVDSYSVAVDGLSASFTVAPAPAPPPVGGGGGGAPAPPPGTTDVRGMVSTAGVFRWSVTAMSEDRLCRLTIPTDTAGLTEELESLTVITMLIMDEPPPPPEDTHVIGLAYDFQPSGATFEPPITLTFTYDEALIPEGVAEENLVIAVWASKWVELDCVVNPGFNTITAEISHFTPFAILAYTRPPAFVASDLSITPAEVDIGQEVTIGILVTNTGDLTGSYEVTLKIAEVVVASEEVTLAGGASEMVTFATAKDVAGTYAVTIDGLSGTFVVGAPSAFVASDLSITPAEVDVGQEVTISVLVINTGDLAGSYEVTVNIDEVVVASEEVTLAGGASEMVTFTTTAKDVAGTYAVTIDGLSGTFVVRIAPAVVVNWPVVGGIIAAVVVGLLVFFLIRRRAY